ncbi:hypothetical protein BCR44DRAFT_1435674 [Catenaria anguillulae PL171]|uniref:Receptor ligand binding region domain-containing protein n=1 Tax=Catenaria anguillulae PL171 TaxID=765915 RepID=A0A1Y2HLL3_9FUNG|nr:hypothetical protein BCR44DRAFT_1435674 [Catenaria anguillulae PL171]
MMTIQVMRSNVSALIGGATSDSSKSISAVLNTFSVPLCSHISASSDLSNKAIYQTFFRYRTTTREDAAGMIAIARGYGWTRFGIVTEAGYAQFALLGSFLAQLASENGMTVPFNIAMQTATPEARNASFTRIYNQLIDTDTRIVMVGHLSDAGARLLLDFYGRGLFDTGVGRTKVFFFLNNAVADLESIAGANSAYTVLQSVAVISIRSQTFKDNTILQDFMTRYSQQNNGQPYPWNATFSFMEGYACGFSMVVGFHRWMRATNATVTDFALKSKRVFSNFSLAYFNVTEDVYPAFPLPLSSAGDPIPRFYYIQAPIATPTGSTSRPYIITAQNVDTVPKSAALGRNLPAWWFPKMPLDQPPPDAAPKAVANLGSQLSNPEGIAVLSLVTATMVLYFASFLSVFWRRSNPILRRSSILVLYLVHFAGMSCSALALFRIFVPTPTTCAIQPFFEYPGVSTFLWAAWARLKPLTEVKAFPKRQLKLQSEVSTDRSTLGHRSPTASAVAAQHSPEEASSPSKAHLMKRRQTGSSIRMGGIPGKMTSIASAMTRRSAEVGLSNLWKHAHLCAVALEDPLSRTGISVTLRAVASLSSLYFVPLFYFMHECRSSTALVQISETLVEFQCTCAAPQIALIRGLWIMVLNLIVCALLLQMAWQTRSSPFNGYESRRWGIGVFNILGMAIVANAFDRLSEQLRTPATLLIAIGGFLSCALIVAPVNQMIHSSQHAGPMSSPPTDAAGENRDPDLRESLGLPKGYDSAGVNMSQPLPLVSGADLKVIAPNRPVVVASAPMRPTNRPGSGASAAGTQGPASPGSLAGATATAVGNQQEQLDSQAVCRFSVQVVMGKPSWVPSRVVRSQIPMRLPTQQELNGHDGHLWLLVDRHQLAVATNIKGAIGRINGWLIISTDKPGEYISGPLDHFAIVIRIDSRGQNRVALRGCSTGRWVSIGFPSSSEMEVFTRMFPREAVRKVTPEIEGKVANPLVSVF